VVDGCSMTRAVVAFAGKMGSTRDIAVAVGEELRRHGLTVDVCDVRAVSSIEDYDAVVLGSAVYAGRWRPEAARFLKRNIPALAKRGVWLFESGWIGKRPQLLAATSGGCKRALQVGAASPTVFGGRLDPARATGPIDRMVAKGKSGDFRNWDEIRAWAATIAATLVTAEHR
jgi:menaquinone-dependent protoporphyrinogen oxidase